eukprot:3934786-Pyramimonas_sp.AAC.1
MPSGPHAQIFTSCTNLLTTRWICRCTNTKEHVLDWHGHDRQHAERRNKNMTFLTSQFVDQLCKDTNEDITQAYLQAFTRTDTNVHNYMQSSDIGPCWGDIVRTPAYT